ncbi:MAG: hypothetical protein JSS51_12615 [Planctomycetes bacterium]|nr:hypothetical protein [Planctomycetota bacterium]
MRTPWVNFDVLMGTDAATNLADEWRWPYDVPDACRFSKISPDRVLIEYQYLDGVEDHNRKHDFGDVALFVGDRTGRVLAIEIDIRSHLSPEMQKRLDEAMATIAEPAMFQRNRLFVRRSFPAVVEESRRLAEAL